MVHTSNSSTLLFNTVCHATYVYMSHMYADDCRICQKKPEKRRGKNAYTTWFQYSRGVVAAVLLQGQVPARLLLPSQLMANGYIQHQTRQGLKQAMFGEP